MTMELGWPPHIEDYIKHAFRDASLNAPIDILPYDECELSRITGLSKTTCKAARKSVIDLYRVPGRTASDFVLNRVYLPSGIGALDAAFEGGMTMSWLVEIHGESGSGKTQFCSSVTCHALRNGRNVLWIDTENSFFPERLVEISGGNDNILHNISVARCTTVASLLSSLDTVAGLCEDSQEPPLLVIDSIAAVFRESHPRKGAIHDIAEKLKSMKCITLCSNHVVADFASESSNEPYKPALGNAWGHHVTCRLSIARDNTNSSSRIIRILKSPTCGTVVIPARICTEGIV